jgi:hypothetical protein
MKTHKFILISLITLFGCNPEKVDTKGVKEEMEKFKIKKISQAEIMEQAGKMGEEIFDLFQVKTVEKNLDSATQNGPIENAFKFCNYSNYTVKDSLENEFKSEIYRAGLLNRLRNTSNQPDSLQKLVLEAYQFNKTKGLDYFTDVQITGNEVLYNKPIVLSQESCLKCHGNPDKEIGSANLQKIKAVFPQDQSTGFKKGDLMGVFTVKMRKEEVVRRVK